MDWQKLRDNKVQCWKRMMGMDPPPLMWRVSHKIYSKGSAHLSSTCHVLCPVRLDVRVTYVRKTWGDISINANID